MPVKVPCPDSPTSSKKLVTGAKSIEWNKQPSLFPTPSLILLAYLEHEYFRHGIYATNISFQNGWIEICNKDLPACYSTSGKMEEKPFIQCMTWVVTWVGKF